MDNGTQRIYMFGEDNKPMKSKKDLEVEERLRALKLKMNGAEEADPNIPPKDNPYYKDFVDDEALRIDTDETGAL